MQEQPSRVPHNYSPKQRRINLLAHPAVKIATGYGCEQHQRDREKNEQPGGPVKKSCFSKDSPLHRITGE
jgi:hypothetical protein